MVPVPDDTLIQLERTACFGDCPTYWVSIQADGTVQFADEGPKGGCTSFKAPRRALAELVALIRDSNYFELKPRYSAPVTDHPSARTFVKLDGRAHRVDHYLADAFVKPGPDADERKRLTAIEKRIDAVANSTRWLKRGGGPSVQVPYTAAQIEAVAAEHAVELRSRCLEASAPRDTVEVSLTVDGSRHGSENAADPWRAGRVAGICSFTTRHPAASCICRESLRWTFPPACGMAEVKVSIDFDRDPPKVTAKNPAPVRNTPFGVPRAPTGRGRL